MIRLNRENAWKPKLNFVKVEMKKLSKQQKNILKHYVGKEDKREAVNAADVELGRVAGNELHAALGYVD